MKMLVANWKFTFIFMMIVLLCSPQTTSYADIDSVKPDNNDTSLIVKFSWSYWRGPSGNASRNFTFKWREKDLQGTWSSTQEVYSTSWITYYIPVRQYSETETYTITGLKPGTTYEVMVNDWEGEGTTSYTRLSISAASALEETNLDKSIVTFTLNYHTYSRDITKIRNAVTVSGIEGVTIDTKTLQYISDTEITIELDFDDTDFDTNTALIFSVGIEAIADYIGEAFTGEISVTAHKESLSASVVSPLTEATLNGSTVELTLTGATYEQDISKIKEAVTVSGIIGVTINSSKIQRLSDRKVTVELGFDGTDFVRDLALTFSVDAGAITNHKGSTLTTEILVTANRDEVLLKMYWTDSGRDKIQRANLDSSDVEALVTEGLSYPNSIAIGISTPVNSTTVKEDVNRDGVVDVQDLVSVAQRYGKTGTNTADVNGDGVVNVDDFILVAAAVDSAAAAAPAARAKVGSHFRETQLQGWLAEARASGNTSRTYQRGIAVIEQLLTLFTPEKTTLLANYPNPFNPETWIPYQLAKSADVSLTIYDIRGVIVRELQLGHQRAGLYQSRSRAAYWDGRNAVGESVASGVYFYTLTAGEFTATRKMLIRK